MTYYNDLGVDETSSNTEIKRAYFKKIRQHPPETDPIGYQRIQDAYKVLSDPTERESYNSTIKYGDRITELDSMASNYFELESWDKAEDCLKEIMLLNPESDNHRNALALVLARQDRFIEAANHLKKLEKKHPKDTLYKLSLAQIYYAQGVNSKFLENFLHKAQRYIQQVIDMEPYHSDAWLFQSRVQFKLGEIELAWESLESAINADGKEDIGDIEAFIFMLELSVLSGRLDMLPSTINRISMIVKDSEDAAKYVAARTIQMADMFKSVNYFQAAHELLSAACVLLPNEKPLKDASDELKVLHESTLEFEHFKDNSRIDIPIRQCCAILLAIQCGEEVDSNLQEAGFLNAMNYALTDPDSCSSDIQYVRLQYPAIAKLSKRLFSELSKGIRKAEESGQIKTTGRMKNPPTCL